MRTHQVPRATRHVTIANDVAKRLTSDLCQHVGRERVSTATVIEMYEWIREGNVPTEELADMTVIARRWDEHQRHSNHGDWLRRAFGD